MFKKKDLSSNLNSATNHSVSSIAKIHTTAFAFFIVFEELIDHILVPKLPEGIIKIFLIVVIDSLLYTIIYFTVYFINDKLLIPSKKQFKLEGTWYHVHIPHFLDNIDYTRDCLRCGETTIRRDLYDFTLSATNYNFSVINGYVQLIDKNSYTTWHTVISEISDSNESDYDIIEIYKADTNIKPLLKLNKCPCCSSHFDEPIVIDEASKTRYGIHKFTIHTNHSYYSKKQGYTYIHTNYYDCWPSSKNGELHLFRNKEDRDNFILEYFEHKNYTH